jgi:hypothetical protein
MRRPQDVCAEVVLELGILSDGAVEAVARDSATGDAIAVEII